MGIVGVIINPDVLDVNAESFTMKILFSTVLDPKMKLREKIKRIETSRLNRNRQNLTSLMEKRKNANLLLVRKSHLWLLMMMTLKIQILKQKIEKGDIWLKKKLNGKHVEYNLKNLKEIPKKNLKIESTRMTINIKKKNQFFFE